MEDRAATNEEQLVIDSTRVLSEKIGTLEDRVAKLEELLLCVCKWPME